MRYLQLLEDDAPLPSAVAPVAAAEPVEPAVAKKQFYHVTTKRRLKQIQELGIVPNKNRHLKTGTGRQLGDRGYIYLIAGFSGAVAWANKIQWERFHGKWPAKPEYVILTVREDPATLEPDPHPDNGRYGKWFQKQGEIQPQDITAVVPLTKAMVKEIMGEGDEKITERDSLPGLLKNYSLEKCTKALLARGWISTGNPDDNLSHSPMEFRNADPDYPEYVIDLDINNYQGGPFIVFRNHKRIGVFKSPPYAQQLALKDRLI